jgi:hypothetical protein
MASSLRSRLQARTTATSRKRLLKHFAEKEGLAPKGGVERLGFSKGDAAEQGIGEVAGELGQTHRLNRIGTLEESLKDRTTLSSRKRALNRILANAGLTAGLTGTKVNPRRTRRPYVR